MEKYNTLQEMIGEAEQRSVKLSDIIIEASCEQMQISEKTFLNLMKINFEAMRNSVIEGKNIEDESPSGLVGDITSSMLKFNESKNIFGKLFSNVITDALAVSELNACMGCIVAAPTAGSCGILPALLFPIQKEHNFTDEQMIRATICASGVGYIIAKNASIAGAEGGCQAECGSAAGMSAAAIVELFGGTAQMSGWACAHALKSFLGLVCDPVAGLVEEPCIVRNVSSAVVAMSSAQLALANIKSIIPVDEVIYTMKEIGDEMDEKYKETALGGLATTKTGTEINNKIYGCKNKCSNK